MSTTELQSAHSPEWYELKGRLFRFLGTQPTWERWTDSNGDWLCGREGWSDRETARDTRVTAIQQDPKLIPSRSIPERHLYTDVTSRGWNRLLLGIFTYLNGPALIDDVATIAGVLLQLPGAANFPTGSPAPVGPDTTAGHITNTQMDAIVEGTLDASSRQAIDAHTGQCAFCSRQLAAYQAGAPIVSAPIKKPKPIEADTSAAPIHPGSEKLTVGEQAVTLMKQPSLLLMVAGGVLLMILGPVLLWQQFAPPTGNPFDEDRVAEVEDVPLDLSALETLDEPFYTRSLSILRAAQPVGAELDPVFGDIDPLNAGPAPVYPQILLSLPDPLGVSLTYPVTESVATTQPMFTWQPNSPPPYTVEVRDPRNRVIARATGLPNPLWMPTTALDPATAYRWKVTFGDGAVEEASFIVLGKPEMDQWNALRSRYLESSLVLGLIAEEMGLLSAAERYFDQLLRENPNSQQAFLLLDNLYAMRE